ncbi:MAG TPA: protein kinase [Coriobacteriia bacterium]
MGARQTSDDFGWGRVDAGLILGRYRLLAELGEGGHGAVDLAFDTKMARRVAIKRIPVTRRGIQILSRTTGLREARTAALLNHPNIVTVYEWDTDDDEAFLIMEHVDGASLAELLDLYAPLDIDEAAAVLAPIADAVAFAHDNGVLHLDLKPENVLITRDGLVKVADFGVAALTNAAGQALSAGGTLGYMPPEQLRGEAVDARTDVWAFAALAFTVLTGAVPFASESIEGSLFKAERGGTPIPGAFEPSVPVPVNDAIVRALSPDPARRQPDLRTFAGDLMVELGDPVAGRDSLRSLATEMTFDEEYDEDPSLVRLGLWDRLAMRSGVAERVVTAAASGWLAWAGMAPLGFPWLAPVAAIIIAAAAGYFAPSLGLGAGLVVLAAGAFRIGWPLGLAVALAGALWWIALGRTRAGAGALPVFAPLAGVLRFSPALPVLAGFFIEGVWTTGAASAATGLVMVVFSIVSRSGVMADVAWPALVAPLSAPWPASGLTGAVLLRGAAAVLAWGVAGVLSALGAHRGTRLGALTGALAGLGVCAAALGPWMTVGSRMAPGALLQMGIASILVVAVVALGPPVRAGDTDDQDVES